MWVWKALKGLPQPSELHFFDQKIMNFESTMFNHAQSYANIANYRSVSLIKSEKMIFYGNGSIY